ncbi:MAG: YcaQ family DNA glycosylase [Candidatus Latescibacterota bacterium]|nr:MAG: YcaQ family DNA glycosylase [Candidatus Latescibacterota bacterium]
MRVARSVERVTRREARRLALARAGLLKPDWTGLPQRTRGRTRRARAAAHAVIERFGYLQLDTVSIAGARSHTIVLLSRLDGFDPTLGEELLQAGEPLFEYWGHEASWIPLALYPAFTFRRREFRHHPWWGDIVGQHPEVVRKLRRRIRNEGPIRSADMEGRGSRGWWDLKIAKKVASALWSSGEFAIRERRNFHRTYDLAERVIPDAVRRSSLPKRAGLEVLLLKALEGHGWATTGTLAATWRLVNRRTEITAALDRLVAQGKVAPCALVNRSGRDTPGWIRPEDRDLASRLLRVRPQQERGVLLSPFDPLLWDRPRVQRLFDFDQILEIFKPAPKRIYGYYCMPVLAGDRLVARFDLKADRKQRALRVLSCRYEGAGGARPSAPQDAEAAGAALYRYADALGLEPTGWKQARGGGRVAHIP